jgi:hypothetical protein
MIQGLTRAASDPGSAVPSARALARWFVSLSTVLPARTPSRNRRTSLSVQDHITIGAGFRKRVTYLLDHPIRRRVPRDIEMQDLTTGALDNEEAVEQLKVDRPNREEVEGDDRFSVFCRNASHCFSERDTMQPPSERPQSPGAFIGTSPASWRQTCIDLEVATYSPPDCGGRKPANVEAPWDLGFADAGACSFWIAVVSCGLLALTDRTRRRGG